MALSLEKAKKGVDYTEEQFTIIRWYYSVPLSIITCKQQILNFTKVLIACLFGTFQDNLK